MGKGAGRYCLREYRCFFGEIKAALLDYAEHSFRLDRTDKDGVSERERLTQIQDQIGKELPDLVGPSFPDLLLVTWENFQSLHSGRTYGMSGPNPLSAADIVAWCDLYQVELSGIDLALIRALDTAFIQAQHSKD